MTDYILISNNRESYPVLQDQIIRLEACVGKTSVYTTDGNEHIYSYNIGEAENLLNKNFFRSHNSHIINLTHIRKVMRGRSYLLKLSCGTYVPVAALKVAEFRRVYYGKHA